LAIDTDRYAGQADLVPRDRFADMTASVIGVGAVGRQVALQLAAIGVRHLQLIDHDSVEASNVTTQGYRQSDIGRSKVGATHQSIAELDPTTEVATVVDRYRSQTTVSAALFCCVDSISARAAIWRSAGPLCRFWADGRMLGEALRVLVMADE
jgi:molybdopterin-synthase adenylyltransferase